MLVFCKLFLFGTFGDKRGPGPANAYALSSLVDFLKREDKDSISWYFWCSDGGSGGVWGPSGPDQSLLMRGQGRKCSPTDFSKLEEIT